MRRNGFREIDVAVLGGGPAGAAVSLGLQNRGHSTIVIEKSGYGGVRVGETLVPSIQPLLSRLGVWERFLAQEHSPSFGIRSAWGQDEIQDTDFIFSPYGAGWHIDRSRFDAMLACCAEESGAEVCRGAKLESCENDGGRWKIEVSCPEKRHRLQAKFLVDASGRGSSFARRRGARRVLADHLIGVFFFTSAAGESASETSTLIEAAETGWWYSAALPGSRLVLAYMTDADLYARERKTLNHCLQQKLERTKHTQFRIGQLAAEAEPFLVAANSSRLDQVTNGENWLAIGDAAMALDPLSGQGVYHALASALRSTQSIHEHLDGNPAALGDLSSAVVRDFDRYLQTRASYYAMEQRWPDSIFWLRRNQPRIAAI